jgi:hypothetical protein
MIATKCSYKTAVSTRQHFDNNGKRLLASPCPHVIVPVGDKGLSLNLVPRVIKILEIAKWKASVDQWILSKEKSVSVDNKMSI